MNEDFDKFEQEIHTHLYSRVIKIVVVLGLLVGMGLVFMATSAPNKPIDADMEIKVKGLVCSSCAIGIKKYLKKEINVKYVAFDIYKHLVLVDFVERDGRVLYSKNDRLITLIEKSGYEVTYIKRLDNNKPNRYNKP
tara:strand:+ start:25 stop:435 length:411 start_codon:yes stop_codon:yes gene_type:complete